MPILDIHKLAYFLNIDKNYILTHKLLIYSNQIKYAGLFGHCAQNPENWCLFTNALDQVIQNFA